MIQRQTRHSGNKTSISNRYTWPAAAETEGVDFTAGTAADTGAFLTISATSIIAASVSELVDCWVVYDGTAGYFTGDITESFTANIPSQWSGVAHRFMTFSNTLGDGREMQNADDGMYLKAACYTTYWAASVCSDEAGTIGPVVANLTYGQDYFFTAFRDWAAKTWTLSVYSDSARTALLATKTIDLTRGGLVDGQIAYRYFYPFVNYKYGSGPTDQGSITISNATISPEI